MDGLDANVELLPRLFGPSPVAVGILGMKLHEREIPNVDVGIGCAPNERTVVPEEDSGKPRQGRTGHASRLELEV